MSRKHAKNIDKASTSFARWRIMCGLTQNEAAEKLKKSRRAVQAYERPNPKTGRPAKPSYSDRVVMDLFAKGMAIPDGWPE